MLSQVKQTLQYGLGFFPSFHEHYIYYKNGKRFKELRQSLEQSEYFSLDQIRAYQNSHFMGIFHHALKHVPYYTKEFEKLGLNTSNIQSLDDIIKLPLIDKNTVQSHSDHFKARNYQEYSPIETKTSGSTGKPLHFLIDQESYTLALALEWRHLNWAGCRFHTKTMIMEFPLGWNKGIIDTTKLYEFDATRKRLRVNSALLNDKSLGEISQILKTFQPDHIRTFPSLAELLGKYVKANNIKIHPKALSVRSERLYPDQRAFIEDTFSCPCFNLFGQWEFVTHAADCQYHHLHSFFELGFTEIIKDGRPCEEGEVGELVCTQLHNYSMPLIRYKTGDLGLIKHTPCACGRVMPILEIVGCRGKDLVVTKKGYFNVQSSLGAKLNSIKRFNQIQFYQETLDHLEVRILEREPFSESETEKLKSLVSSYFFDSIKVSIKFVDEINRTPAGKYHYVESKVPISF